MKCIKTNVDKVQKRSDPNVGDQVHEKVLMDEGIGSFEVTDQEYPFNELEEPEEFLDYDGILNNQIYKSYKSNAKDQKSSNKESANEKAKRKLPVVMQM